LAYCADILLDKNAKVLSGEVIFDDKDLLLLSEKQMQVTGRKIG
jgi:ABC-type dipeptide/oligopeptide/nickel transport system ATPase component